MSYRSSLSNQYKRHRTERRPRTEVLKLFICILLLFHLFSLLAFYFFGSSRLTYNVIIRGSILIGTLPIIIIIVTIIITSCHIALVQKKIQTEKGEEESKTKY